MARPGASGRGPANIMKHMKGISFPADKNQLMILVEKNRSRAVDTDMVKAVIEKMPDKMYNAVGEITKEAGKIS